MIPARARSFIRVAADVSRRILSAAEMAPTDVGSYTLSVNRAECEISRRDLIRNNGAKLRIIVARARQTRD